MSHLGLGTCNILEILLFSIIFIFFLKKFNIDYKNIMQNF